MKAVEVEAPKPNAMQRKFEGRVSWVLYYFQHTGGARPRFEFGCCFGAVAFADAELAHGCCPASCGSSNDVGCSVCWGCEDKPLSGGCVPCLAYTCCFAAPFAPCIAMTMTCCASKVCSCCKDCSVCIPLVCDIGTVDPNDAPNLRPLEDVNRT